MFKDYTKTERIVIFISGIGLMMLATMQLYIAIVSI